MKITVCGAGLVGRNIAGQLDKEGHDVTVIDQSDALLREISNTMEVRTFTGESTHPEVLEEAGMKDAEIVIAVTKDDEINMVICLLAHVLFGVPRKIARIRHQGISTTYRDRLFGQKQIPIDIVISPDLEVGNAVLRRLSVPGAFDAMDFVGGKICLAGVVASPDCPVINLPIMQLHTTFPGLRTVVTGIVRDQEMIIPDQYTRIEEEDEIYFVADARDLNRVLSVFGHKEKEASRVLIAGAGKIGAYVASELKQNHHVQFTFIDADHARAVNAADTFQDSIVLHGNILDASLMREGGIEEAETFVALTSDDEANILSAVVAKQLGCKKVITLYNNASYGNIMRSLDIDAYISPRALTVSAILRHVRRGRIAMLHSIHDGVAEAIEVEALAASRLVGRPLGELNLPKNIIIGSIWRNDTFIIPNKNAIVQAGDHVVIFALAGQIQAIEPLFETVEKKN